MVKIFFLLYRIGGIDTYWNELLPKFSILCNTNVILFSSSLNVDRLY